MRVLQATPAGEMRWPVMATVRVSIFISVKPVGAWKLGKSKGLGGCELMHANLCMRSHTCSMCSSVQGLHEPPARIQNSRSAPRQAG